MRGVAGRCLCEQPVFPRTSPAPMLRLQRRGRHRHGAEPYLVLRFFRSGEGFYPVGAEYRGGL